jgi:hypothetical protein
VSAQGAPDRLGRWLAVAASVVVVLAIVAAIWVMGSPSTQREANLDARRVDDLSHIARLLDDHVSTYGTLPPDLATLAKQPGRRLAIVDPVDGRPYGYEVTGARTYRLCAVFVTDTSEIPAAAGPWRAEQWTHGKGRHCFDRRAQSKGRTGSGSPVD